MMKIFMMKRILKYRNDSILKSSSIFVMVDNFCYELLLNYKMTLIRVKIIIEFFQLLNINVITSLLKSHNHFFELVQNYEDEKYFK